jgi:formate transporter
MYFVPLGILLRTGAPASFWSAIDAVPADYEAVTWSGFLMNNLMPVTIGNIVGGVVLVGVTYWFVYLRVRSS